MLVTAQDEPDPSIVTVPTLPENVPITPAPDVTVPPLETLSVPVPDCPTAIPLVATRLVPAPSTVTAPTARLGSDLDGLRAHGCTLRDGQRACSRAADENRAGGRQ